MDKKRPVPPHAGGCWYCGRDNGELWWCGEFDTAVHPDCVRQAVYRDALDREAAIIARDIGVTPWPAQA